MRKITITLLIVGILFVGLVGADIAGLTATNQNVELTKAQKTALTDAKIKYIVRGEMECSGYSCNLIVYNNQSMLQVMTLDRYTDGVLKDDTTLKAEMDKEIASRLKEYANNLITSKNTSIEYKTGKGEITIVEVKG